MKRLALIAALLVSCMQAFAKDDEIKKYTDDDDKLVIKHKEMECFDDLSDEGYLMWREDEGYTFVFKLKKDNVSGSKSIDIVMNDGSTVKLKANCIKSDKYYNPWTGWIHVSEMAVLLTEDVLNAILNQDVKEFNLYYQGRGEDSYDWGRDRKGKWDFDKNFKHMYECINKNMKK